MLFIKTRSQKKQEQFFNGITDAGDVAELTADYRPTTLPVGNMSFKQVNLI